jgi:hypothetical protein
MPRVTQVSRPSLDLADHVEHRGEVLFFRAAPGGAHAEARGALGLGGAGVFEHFVEGQQGFLFEAGVVADDWEQ